MAAVGWPSVGEQGLVGDGGGYVELNESPRAVLPDGYASHPQRDGLSREDEGHLIREPARVTRGPARRRARLEGDSAMLAKAVIQPLLGVRVTREPLVRPIADDRGGLAFSEKARHGHGVTGLQAGEGQMVAVVDREGCIFRGGLQECRHPGPVGGLGRPADDTFDRLDDHGRLGPEADGRIFVSYSLVGYQAALLDKDDGKPSAARSFYDQAREAFDDLRAGVAAAH